MQEEEKVKQQLQTIIKDIGLKDELKKQLRVKIAQKLQLSGVQNLPNTNDILRHRIIASVLREHLDRSGCSYTSSIYGAQSGFDQKMLERVQLIELLGLGKVDKELSLMQYLIEKMPGRATLLRNVEIQTVQAEGSLSLQQKFAVMDLQFRRVLEEKRRPNAAINVHKCTEEKEWYQKQLSKFKQFQAHKIKIRVGEEWRRKFQVYAQEMEDDYRRRIDKIRQRQRNLTDQAAGKQKNIQQKIKGWQGSAKSRMQLLQMKQNAVTRERMNLQVDRRKLTEEGKKVIEQVKQKGRQYDKLLLSVQNRIDYQVGLIKLSIQQAQNQREEQFANRRRFVDQEYGKLMGIKDSMEILKRQNQRMGKENQILRQQCKRLRQELRSAYGDVSTKGDRLDNLRQQNTDLKNQKKDFEIKMSEQIKIRKKRQQQVVQARKQLQVMRAKIMEQQEQDESQVFVSKNKEMNLIIANLKDQRRKDIEKLKMEL